MLNYPKIFFVSIFVAIAIGLLIYPVCCDLWHIFCQDDNMMVRVAKMIYIFAASMIVGYIGAKMVGDPRN